MTEYEFARNFAFAWFRLNKIDMYEHATANRIAKTLKLDREGSGAGYAKKAVIKWHLQVIKDANKPKQAPPDKEDFYSSQSWRAVRYEALKRSRGCCELCGSPPGQYSLHVDHVRPRSKFPQFALDVENLQVLCRDCNLGKSNTDCIDWR